MTKLTLLILVVTTGCVSNHRDFSVYKTKPFQGEVNFPIKGIYFLKEYTNTRYYEHPYAILFYADGSVSAYNSHQVSNVPEAQFWNRPEEYLQSMHLSTSPGEPGHFTFRNDTLVIEFFTYRGGIPQQGTNRFEGTVNKDSTIVLWRQICKWCHIRAVDFPKNGVKDLREVRYNFYRTDIRPDSSNFWIKRTKWYKKCVWHRR